MDLGSRAIPGRRRGWFPSGLTDERHRTPFHTAESSSSLSVRVVLVVQGVRTEVLSRAEGSAGLWPRAPVCCGVQPH